MRRKKIDPELFLSNLNFQSNIFRHSLRVAAALLIGYVISIAFNIGHSYWILLTIVVILKPAYGLTKSRNLDRLLGTFAGLVAGAAILFVVKQPVVLLIIMLIFMAGGYMFIRTRYFISVGLMTIFLVLFFHQISPGTIAVLLKDRLLDTLIGSAIAFLAGIIVVPAWEHRSIRKLMENLAEKNIEYFSALSDKFSGKKSPEEPRMKKARNRALTAFANVSDSFNRMLSEPKRFQKDRELIYRFVVLNNILQSHFAALTFYLRENSNPFFSPALEKISTQIINRFKETRNIFNDLHERTQPADDFLSSDIEIIAAEISQKRREEIAAGMADTETRKKVIAVRSVTDQFTYIDRLSWDIFKNANELYPHSGADQQAGQET